MSSAAAGLDTSVCLCASLRVVSLCVVSLCVHVALTGFIAPELCGGRDELVVATAASDLYSAGLCFRALVPARLCDAMG